MKLLSWKGLLLQVCLHTCCPCEPDGDGLLLLSDAVVTLMPSIQIM